METPVLADFKVVKSRNGRNCVIIMDGSGFSFSKSSNQIWRCSKRNSHKCSAMLKIQEGWIISWKNGHNHKPEELENALSVEFEDEIVQKHFKN
jgi:hypothetical protein